MPGKRFVSIFSLFLTLSLAATGCGSGAKDAVDWRCQSDSKIEAGMSYLLGPGVESTQSAGNITFKADGSVEASFNGAGRTPGANFAGNGVWKVSSQNAKTIFDLSFSEWTSWEGADNPSPSVFKRELGDGRQSCDCSGLRFCDTGFYCSSNYWLITTK